MFIGHYAVGFAAKRFAPKSSLGALIAAPLLLDMLWPVFLLLGWEQVRIDPGATAFTPLDFVSYPYSHSLVTTLGWATLFALLYYLATRYRAGTIAIWFGVVSHWVFDAIVHRPDLPLYPGGRTLVGFSLWNSVPATILIESVLFIIGVWLYARATRPVDGIGKYGFWSFVALIVLLYVGNLFSPPPGSVTTLAYVALSFWLVIPIAWWFDRHRKARVGS
jgi:hypothetical protein